MNDDDENDSRCSSSSSDETDSSSPSPLIQAQIAAERINARLCPLFERCTSEYVRILRSIEQFRPQELQLHAQYTIFDLLLSLDDAEEGRVPMIAEAMPRSVCYVDANGRALTRSVASSDYSAVVSAMVVGYDSSRMPIDTRWRFEGAHRDFVLPGGMSSADGDAKSFEMINQTQLYRRDTVQFCSLDALGFDETALFTNEARANPSRPDRELLVSRAYRYARLLYQVARAQSLELETDATLRASTPADRAYTPHQGASEYSFERERLKAAAQFIATTLARGNNVCAAPQSLHVEPFVHDTWSGAAALRRANLNQRRGQSSTFVDSALRGSLTLVTVIAQKNRSSNGFQGVVPR